MYYVCRTETLSRNKILILYESGRNKNPTMRPITTTSFRVHAITFSGVADNRGGGLSRYTMYTYTRVYTIYTLIDIALQWRWRRQRRKACPFAVDF